MSSLEVLDTSRRAASNAAAVEIPIIPPAAVLSTTEAVWYAVNRMNVMRFWTERRIIPAQVMIDCTVASGNIEVPIYKVTRTGTNAFTLTKVATSGVIACPTPTNNAIWVSILGSQVLEPGSYGLGLWCDNTTAAFAHAASNSAVRAGWCLSDGGASSGGAPASVTGAFAGSRSFAATLEAAIS